MSLCGFCAKQCTYLATYFQVWYFLACYPQVACYVQEACCLLKAHLSKTNGETLPDSSSLCLGLTRVVLLLLLLGVPTPL